MLKRIAAITFIFSCTTLGWGVLGSTIYYRSSAPVQPLRDSVSNTWGVAQEQKPPTVGADPTSTIDPEPRRKRAPNRACFGSSYQPSQVRSVEECAQAAVAAGMTEFAQSLCFDLPYALSGHTEVVANLFQRVLGAVLRSEPHLDDALFTRRERVQHLLHQFL